jgi:hypothetical protein
MRGVCAVAGVASARRVVHGECRLVGAGVVRWLVAGHSHARIAHARAVCTTARAVLALVRVRAFPCVARALRRVHRQPRRVLTDVWRWRVAHDLVAGAATRGAVARAAAARAARTRIAPRAPATAAGGAATRAVELVVRNEAAIRPGAGPHEPRANHGGGKALRAPTHRSTMVRAFPDRRGYRLLSCRNSLAYRPGAVRPARRPWRANGARYSRSG